MKTRMIVLSVCLLLCLLTFPAVAQIPKTITYQGSLTDAAGVPLNEPVSMHFALFEGPGGGVSLWDEAHPSVAVENGIYSVTLGASSPLDLAFDKTYYLEISIGGGAPLAPRHALSSAPYALKAAGVDGLTVKDGRIGVRMSDPPKELSVKGQMLLFSGNANNYGWQVYTIPGGIPDEAFAGSLSFHENTNADYTGSHRMVIRPGGAVGINNVNPQYQLDVSGYIRGTNLSPSDLRWKEDVTPLDHSLDRFTQLRAVSFRWKEPAEGEEGFHPMGIEPVSGMKTAADAPPVRTRTAVQEERRQIGLIAQEVEAVFPEAVFTDENGYKSVAYDMLVAPLIDAVNGLKAENKSLRQDNATLRQTLEALEARISALEQ